MKLNGYEIEFYSQTEWDTMSISGTNERNVLPIGIPLKNCTKELLKCEYIGLCSEIPEKLAKKIVSVDFEYSIFRNGKIITFSGHTAKEHFQTLSELKYCIIHKIK